MGPRDYIDRPGGSPQPMEEEDDSYVLDLEPSGLLQLTVTPEHGGWRLDRAIAASLPTVSRTRIQGWIEQGAARINSSVARARDRVAVGDRLQIEAQEPAEAAAFKPESMPLVIAYEDDLLIVIAKPAGLVVHPGAGNWSGTLLNGLLAHHPPLSAVARAGIVHRLDAGTSGLMVVAKTWSAQLDLTRQLQQRSILREYWAIVTCLAPISGTIDAALSRDPRNPLRFRTSRLADARTARTHFRRIAASQPDAGQVGAVLSWLACRLDTGRTHQIRVHLESIGHPVLGDPVYSKHRPAVRGVALELKRQALHACRLSLRHPGDGRTMSWFCPPPADLYELMQAVGFSAEQPVDAFMSERTP